MPSHFYRYWGKSQHQNSIDICNSDIRSYHLLPYHCLDVAAVGNLLLHPSKLLCISLARQLELSPESLRSFFTFLLAIHDIGKFSRGFQALAPNLSPNLVSPLRGFYYLHRHDKIGQVFWNQCLKKQLSQWIKNRSFSAPEIKISSLNPWMKIVLGHHGQPVDDDLNSIHYHTYFHNDDEDAAIGFAETLLTFIDVDFSLLASKTVAKKIKMASWTLAGIAVLADWIGSNQDCFRYRTENLPLEDYFEKHALPSAVIAIKNLKLYDASIASFQGIAHLFPGISVPSPLQQFAVTADLPLEPQLHIFEDVTGAGKTEAALSLAHRLMDMGLASGLYIALPSMATANAMYERMVHAYEHLFTMSQGKKPSLILAHGAKSLSPLFTESIGLEALKNKDGYTASESGSGAWCNAWLADNAKKAFLAEVGVGTLDQALLSILPAKHQCLRLLGLRGKILIVDEVHAYDPYMQKLLETLLHMHSAGGGSAILLSATLPMGMRKALTCAFSEGLGCGDDKAGLGILKNENYPLVTTVFKNRFLETPVATRSCVMRKVSVTLSADFDELVRLVVDALRADRCVCWIRNTVKDAVETFSFFRESAGAVLDHGRMSLFHSRFAMVDRQRIESDVLEKFGKKSGNKIRKGQLLIATQVVEQSLDLDFDVLVSDLAPIDLLIQRAGRLCRHNRDFHGNISEAEGRGTPQFFVFSPDPVKEPSARWLTSLLPGTAAVYPHTGQLWRGATILKKRCSFTMPDDARSLVEFVYSDLDDNIIPQGLESQSLEAEGEHSTKRGMARINQLDIKAGYCIASASASGGWDDEVRIPTRLGITAVQCVLAHMEHGRLIPYADIDLFPWSFSKINLPAYYVEQIEKVIPEEIRTVIAALKDDVPALKWQTIIPLIPGIAQYYSRDSGFYIPMEV